MLHSIEKVGLPFHTIHIDHLGPFPQSRHGNTYLIVAVDAFTKFVLLRPARNTNAQPTVSFLKNIVRLFGPPTRVITDRGGAYTSNAFQRCCRALNIAHVLNSTANPRANGQVERYNRVVTTSIATLTTDVEGRDWDELLEQVQWSLNNTFQKATRTTPFRLLFAYESRHFKGDSLEDALRGKTNVTETEIATRRLAAIHAIRTEQEKQQRRYNKKRCSASAFEPGDIVVVERESLPTGHARKLLKKFQGPYVVTEKLPNDTYRVEDIPGRSLTQRFYTSTAPIDKMKRYYAFDLDNEPDHDDCEDEEDN